MKDSLEGSKPFKEGHWRVIDVLAGVGGQHRTVSYVALHHKEPSAENNLFYKLKRKTNCSWEQAECPQQRASLRRPAS